MQLCSGRQCTHTGAEYVLNDFVCVLQAIYPLFRHQLGPTVTDTPWSQGPVSFPGGAMVAHWVKMCAFVVPHVCLRRMLDINGSAGKCGVLY